jgi:phage terminase large subunit
MNDYLQKINAYNRIHIARPGLQLSIIAVRNHVLSASGVRRIFIDPRYCTRFIRDAQSYHYPTDKNGNINSEEPEKDGIVDNTQDEFRYGISHISPIRSNKIIVQNR